MTHHSKLFLPILFVLLLSCSNNKESNAISTKEEKSYSDTDENGCGFSDDTYSATVNYSNSETGYSNTYTLDVEVENCEVVQINFPKGGWLDEEHISPSEIDNDGTCTVEGEDGKTYEIQINK